MNKILRLSLIALLAVFCGGGTISAVEKNIYSYVPAKNTSNTGYASVYNVTYNGMDWSVPGNQYEDAGLRIGGKSLTNVDRTITGKSTFSQAITKVVISHGGISNTNFTVNSIKLTAASNKEFTSDLKSCTYTPANGDIKVNTDGSITLKLDEGSFAANSYYKIDFNVSNSKTSNYYIKIKAIDFYADVNEGDIVSDPVINPESGVYTEAQTVTITQKDNKEIYYTIDGSDPKSSETAEKYTASFTVSETTVVKAAAKDGDNWSTVVTSNIAIAKEYTSFKELQENVTKDSQPAVINFKNAIVTAVNKSGNNAYVVDEDGYGALIYANNHGFEAGDKISGKAIGAFVLYTGKTEITGITSASEGLTITKGNTVPVTEVAIDELSLKEQSSVVKISGLTLDESTTEKAIYLTDGINKIQVYGSFMTLPTFEDNKTYTITGVVVWFNTTLEIAPRSEADIVSVPTAISDIKAGAINANAPIYNLAGQRVNKTAKGILIQNGKKFMNK